MKHTNKELLGKGVKYLGGAIPLAFIGPAILYSAFNNENHPWYPVVLGIGLLFCGTAVFFMFKGILTLVRSLFD